MTNALTVTHGGGDMMFMPVMDMEAAVARRNFVVEFVSRIMVLDKDYGKIPGAGDKPTLLKPGAEKLATVFGLTPMFIPVSVTEDWTGDDHKGEAFFYYRYRCELHRNGNLIASSEGSCNTWESKYRYRKGERICPVCGQPAIIKGKKEYGGGWVCFKKKGGCDAKFNDGDAAIEKQEVGRVLNPDVADQVNTVQKMAQKRALIAATLLAVNASEFFTQDIEDMVIDGEWSPVMEAKATETKTTEQPKSAKAQSKSAPRNESFRDEPPMDNPFDDAPAAQATAGDDAPAAHELAIINQWQGPQDAQNWAVAMELCDNDNHAKQAWINVVRECRGYSAKNKQVVMLHFLRDRSAKMQARQPELAAA